MNQVLFTTDKFAVERREFEVRGRRISKDLIVHPGAVVILPFLDKAGDRDKRRIVAIRNHRRAVGERLLELPAGTLGVGEDPTQCAFRELEEETGYQARSIRPLADFFPSPGILTEKMHAFVAEDLSAHRPCLEPDEEISVEIIEYGRLISAIHVGQVHDGKTIAAVLLHRLREECAGGV
jgi:ADP-ribose pyrophosphatase